MMEPNGSSRVIDPYFESESKWLSREAGHVVKLYHTIGTKETPATNFNVGIYSLMPGESIPAHEHEAGEEFVFVLHGSGVLTGEDNRTLGPITEGKLVYVQARAYHGYSNGTDLPLELLVWCSKDSSLAY